VDYEGYTIWLDCDKKSAIRFRYNAQRDSGSYKRAKHFKPDPRIPKYCQQSSGKSYREQGKTTQFDRGHLVPANHLDHSKKAIRESNYMTNILPQAKFMNRGAWLLTEEIVECYRDIDELLVLGGAWWDNSIDSRFMKSHGLPDIPDYFWKVIIRNDRIISWWIPNRQSATKKRLDDYLVTADFIQEKTGLALPIEPYLLDQKPTLSWYIPRGCNKG